MMALAASLLTVSHRAAQRRALFVLALTLAIGGTGFITQAWGAGAFPRKPQHGRTGDFVEGISKLEVPCPRIFPVPGGSGLPPYPFLYQPLRGRSVIANIRQPPR